MSEHITRIRRGSLHLEAVRGPSQGTTTTYRAYVQGFTRSEHAQTVEGFAEYIREITGKRPAASVNLAIAAGKAAFLQAAMRAGMDTRELTLLKGALSELRNVRHQMADVATITPGGAGAAVRSSPPQGPADSRNAVPDRRTCERDRRTKARSREGKRARRAAAVRQGKQGTASDYHPGAVRAHNGRVPPGWRVTYSPRTRAIHIGGHTSHGRSTRQRGARSGVR